MRFFFSFFPFLPVRVRSRAYVKYDKRSHCSQQSTSKISPAQLHHLCQNHRTEFFFFSTPKQKKLTTALKKRERGSDRDRRRRRRSTLRDETESVQCTPCGKKKLPVSLTSHRKQPHRTGCESTRHHANNTAHTEGVIPVQKQMHTASSSDVKTTCRSLRFRPHAADRVSFLGKLAQHLYTTATLQLKPELSKNPMQFRCSLQNSHSFKGNEVKYEELYTLCVSKSSKGGIRKILCHL